MPMMLFAPIPYAPKWWKSEGVLGEKFPNQAALKSRIRGIIGRAECGVALADSDAAFLVEVLRRHHHWSGKQGAGIDSIEVRLNPPPGFGTATRGLWLIRTDKTEVDISWVVPLQPGGASSVKNDLALAARREVSAQTRAEYERARGTACPICGLPLLTGHVDHVAPQTFERLLADWLESERLEAHDVTVADLGVESAFEDRQLASRWFQFHLINARLRVIHPHENLSVARSGRSRY